MSINKEAKARILINKKLEDSGWRFLETSEGPANIELEPNVKLTKNDIDSMGDDFELTKNGFVDYLLLDEKGDPFVVVEAKSAKVHPLTAKEQARSYANSLRIKYIILSNGNVSYFWNLEKGNPEMITTFPTYESLKESKALNQDVTAFVNAEVDKYYVAKSQDPTLVLSSEYNSKIDKHILEYCKKNNLRVLRDYQLKAIKSIQQAVKDGKSRFLFEMATGTGKTLTASGVCKLFIRSELANRILFLVDRIELENQALKDLRRYLSKDGIRVEIYKQHKEDWRVADIVVSTIQSIAHEGKYKEYFSPTDFDFLISDEAHRSLGASNRAVLEYFMGYKLGLTATPKNYLKGVEFDSTDPRELEKRLLLDTYSIFGCSGGNPTFSYTLNDGVKDGILNNPKIIDARTDVTTQLLSDDGLVLSIEQDNVEVQLHMKNEKNEVVFTEKSFEKKFFSDNTNFVLCKTFMENAQRDPISNEIGKSIAFCVNINHARKITELLNNIADIMYPGKYNSDFAVQITSDIPSAQDMTIAFANNNLNGHTTFIQDYDSSKTRVAVTVGMMTTGYDCPDLLNVALFRPIFSPSEFIQIKGRGTRLYSFRYEDTLINKEYFKLFDFFAVCEYFENDFNYDEKIKLPAVRHSEDGTTGGGSTGGGGIIDFVINKGVDYLKKIDSIDVLADGMKVDRKFYQSFEEKVNTDPRIAELIRDNQESALEFYLLNEVFDKPNEFYTVKKLEKALGLDRHLSIKEIVAKLMGKIDNYKSKTEILEEEFDNFLLLNKTELIPYADKVVNLKNVFQAYLLDKQIREAIKTKQFQAIITSPIKTDFISLKDVTIKGMKAVDYIEDYVLVHDINYDKFD